MSPLDLQQTVEERQKVRHIGTIDPLQSVRLLVDQCQTLRIQVQSIGAAKEMPETPEFVQAVVDRIAKRLLHRPREMTSLAAPSAQVSVE